MISPDLRFLVSGSWDDTIRVWDLHTGKPIRKFTGHKAGVKQVALSSDQSFIVSASTDFTVKVWNAAEISQ